LREQLARVHEQLRALKENPPAADLYNAFQEEVRRLESQRSRLEDWIAWNLNQGWVVKHQLPWFRPGQSTPEHERTDTLYVSACTDKEVIWALRGLVTKKPGRRRYPKRFAADWVVNGNVHAAELKYKKEKRTRLALGPRYFIFSDELLKARKVRTFPKGVRKILVTMGGADPLNQTQKVLKALALLKMPHLSVMAVAGFANKNFESLCRLARKLPYDCRVLGSAPRMGALMAKADLGISAGGRVATEMLFMGLPSLKIILADNQKGLVREMHRAGVAINLGWYPKVTAQRIAKETARLMRDVALRRKMSHKGRQLFDGHGTKRVVRILNQLAPVPPKASLASGGKRRG